MKYNFIIIVIISLLASCSSHSNENKQEGKKQLQKMPAYQTANVIKEGVAAIVKLPAQIAAFEEVSIYPKVNAYVKKVMVDIGSSVKKGSLLMVLEAPELEQAALQAKERYTRAQADYSLDKEHKERLMEAAKTHGAISPMDISTIKTKVDADMAVCNAEKANWQMQQSFLDYLQVTAPFDGVITERNVHPGALVNAVSKDKPMLELKQVKHLRLMVDIPESIAASINNKDTISFFTSASPGKRRIGNISRKSMNINPQFRSERMEIDVFNTDGSLSPGMYAEIVFHLKGSREALSVPKSAVVTSTERKYVLLMKNGRIKKIDVVTGNESLTNIEIFGLIEAGDQVIINANEDIKEQG
jgi:RND family efflux transporter MFP subunit